MRNSRRAGKPAGRKPEKQGLTGLFTKGKNIPTTAQQTLPYREMYRDGVCRVADRYYTKTIEYEDINYQLAQSEDQAAIFDGWSACLNYFDSSLPFQLSFLNHRSRPGSRYSVNIPMQDDDYNSVRCEYVEMLENQIAKSNNGIVRTKLLTFGVNVDDLSTARARLERVEADICGNFKKLGVKCRSLSGLERLELLHGQLHPGSGSPFRFSWDMIPKTGLSTKDFIAPDSFDFRFSRLFRVGTTWGAASYLQILASELSDKLLAELLEMDAEMTITLHIQTVDQAAAVKSIKAKVSDIDKMKVEEQKKAARSGYDMDILPPDLVTYSNDAKTLLEDLQSRNERMFLLTFLVVNMAPTRRELDNDLFTVSGIVQKYNCTLKRLDFQQEDGFLSSLPLGHNGIEIKRGMTTSSTAIFVPFMTQELRMDGEAVYYGLNALSHNVIMANRKKLKNPNGLFLGVPGSGKSFAAKRELVNVFLATRDRIIVVDPMGEYSPLIKRLGGQVIEIAPDSPHHINPMDIDLSFDEENPMALKADFILSLMELIVGGKDGLQPVERTVIDRCVRQMYREHLQNPETSKMPTLQTLYDLLCSQPEGEAVRLATSRRLRFEDEDTGQDSPSGHDGPKSKPYLWEGIYNGGEDTGPSYEIPGEALDDPAFAALMEEATKYIGWPYVWGGSSPSTSFDCSGFVCWVYTASGVHNLPRTTAQGIYNQCAIISPSEAKPGDIIFFTGTYDSPGPVSHVGIYVGDGMMLHCGSPIQYANINSSYWQTHFYAFGRL